MTTRAERIASYLASYETRLTAYRNAETALLSGGQSYSIGNRTLTRADLEWIQKAIEELEGKIMLLDSDGDIRIQRVVPRDI